MKLFKKSARADSEKPNCHHNSRINGDTSKASTASVKMMMARSLGTGELSSQGRVSRFVVPVADPVPAPAPSNNGNGSNNNNNNNNDTLMKPKIVRTNTSSTTDSEDSLSSSFASTTSRIQSETIDVQVASAPERKNLIGNRSQTCFIRVTDLTISTAETGNGNDDVDNGEEIDDPTDATVSSKSSDEEDNRSNHAHDNNCCTPKHQRQQQRQRQHKFANYRYPSVKPPPGVAYDKNELWIGLDMMTTTSTSASTRSEGHGSTLSYIAPVALRALSDYALSTLFNPDMWNADSKTSSLLAKSKVAWMRDTFHRHGPISSFMTHESVLVWSTTSAFSKRSSYGYDLPAVRSAGLVQASPEDVMSLILSSSRVKEYNKFSLGRLDLLVLDDSLSDVIEQRRQGSRNHDSNSSNNNMITDTTVLLPKNNTPNALKYPSTTVVTRSENKPPVVRKSVVFETMLHSFELEDQSGYVVVSRGVHGSAGNAHSASSSPSSSIAGEILLGVNLIKRVQGSHNHCIMINMTHMKSSMVPQMVAKRLGLVAAANFIKDIRAVCEK